MQSLVPVLLMIVSCPIGEDWEMLYDREQRYVWFLGAKASPQYVSAAPIGLRSDVRQGKKCGRSDAVVVWDAR